MSMKGNLVITIGRQCGSGGKKIGETIAERLGIKCYDKELLTLAAKNSGLCEELFETHDEKPTSSFLYSLVMDTYSMGYSNSAYMDMPLNHKIFLAQFDTIKKLAEEGVITADKKIVLYGLDTYSFAMRTILSNLGFQIDSYLSDEPELLLRFKRNLKSIRARYLKSSRDLIGICSLEERLQPFDSSVLIISSSKNCPKEKIENLYETINFLGFNATYSRNNNYAQNTRKIIPQIQEFVQWFLTDISGLEEGVYLNLIDILKDCETALQEDDNVLMMDALEQGLSEYLEMFLSEEYFREKETSYVNGNAGQES